ncbi:LysR family transcriptional regulator [Microvirga arabica]|uniref:LysR family transcriptional regulator n=1 Tax=Microvirga arabica TaxID=1128671 RepID=UPI00193ADD99|nr:LysR family transcriptional regulator [Microvirga arabica]MBM1175270.1 LysR family transcriptional regulator [Microvirga arabica]
MIPFTLRQLQYFVSAVEHGGTAQAAHALNVSQPSVSMAIKQLEETLGEVLFVRHHAKGLVLTPAGKSKLAEARSLLSQSKAWIASPNGMNGRDAWIDVGCLITLGPSHVPAIIRRFRQHNPGVQVRLHEANVEQLHHLIDNGSIEVALTYDLDLGRSGNMEVVGHLKPYALVSSDHPWATRRTVSLREIAENPLILINLPYSREYFLSLFRLVGVTPIIAMETQSLEMVRGMVANGHGISVLVTNPYPQVSYDGRPLVSLEIAEMVPPQKVVVITPRQFPVTWMAEAFIQSIREHFSFKSMA